MPTSTAVLSGATNDTLTSKSSATRQRIIGEARRRFLAHGFRTVTMDELASDMGMSKKTLYAFFPSKTALLEAVLSEKLAGAGADLELILDNRSDKFTAKLHAMLTCLQKHAAEVQPAFLNDIRREAPELFAFVQTRRREHILRHFGRLLTEGARSGIIRKDVPVPLLVQMLIGLMDTIVTPQRLEELGMTIETGFTAVITIFIEGAIAPTARTKKIKAFL